MRRPAPRPARAVLLAAVLGLAPALQGCDPMSMLMPILSKISGMIGPLGKAIPQISKLTSALPIAGGKIDPLGAIQQVAGAVGMPQVSGALNAGVGAVRDLGLASKDTSVASVGKAASSVARIVPGQAGGALRAAASAADSVAGMDPRQLQGLFGKG